jgi:hypothetical protein
LNEAFDKTLYLLEVKEEIEKLWHQKKKQPQWF